MNNPKTRTVPASHLQVGDWVKGKSDTQSLTITQINHVSSDELHITFHTNADVDNHPETITHTITPDTPYHLYDKPARTEIHLTKDAVSYVPQWILGAGSVVQLTTQIPRYGGGFVEFDANIPDSNTTVTVKIPNTAIAGIASLSYE
ncbi:hypothetical protein [Williamsia muralis]|uniref:Uncharacterized protein n=1 Tax=Williamsia marianensis TaxID=85044 RepID=A0ABU4F106_WILMA|nr:hypothetical protein [Williamsia muralis]MDV7137173.1 hypothetical protein [Williamsia muralis]